MFTCDKDRFTDFVNLCIENDFNVNTKVKQWLIDNNFFVSPASTKYHGAHEGGLYDHSRAVYKRLQSLTTDNNLQWQRPQSPFIIGMFHDLCKCDQYTKVYDDDEYVTEGTKLVPKARFHYVFNADTVLKGHGSKSIIFLSQLFSLTEEEMLCIRFHMGAYENDEWTEFDKAIRKCPNVLWTHMADMLASKVDDI